MAFAEWQLRHAYANPCSMSEAPVWVFAIVWSEAAKVREFDDPGERASWIKS